MNKRNQIQTVFRRLGLSMFGAVAVFNAAIVSAASPHIVDVLVVYDDATDKDIQAGAETYINQIVAYTNKAYQSSDMNLQIRLVHSQKIEVPGVSQVSERGLGNLANNAEVAQLREDYGADLVAMLAPAQGSPQTGMLCGIAYVGMGDRGKFNSYAKSIAYSLTGYDCGAITFAHELGHNMGLGHSHAQRDRGGVFDYGLGHGVRYNFSTIMAYPHVYGLSNSLDYFSNPRLNLCEGEPCGIPEGSPGQADAAHAVNQVAEQLAAWRATVVPDNGTNPPGTNPQDPNDPGSNPSDPNDPGSNPADPNDPGSNPSDPNDPGSNPADPNDPGSNPADPNNPGADPTDPSRVPVTGVAFTKNELKIFIEEVSQLNHTIIPANATNQEVRYSSDNEDIAIVSNNGLVVARNSGNTVIKVVTDDGQERAGVEVKVLERPKITKVDEAGSLTPLALCLFGLFFFRRRFPS